MAPGTEHRRLVDRGEEAVLVHRQAGLLRAVRIRHDDICRQRLRFRAKAVHDPASHGWKAGNHAAGHHLVLGRGVHDHIAVHGADHAEIVDDLRLVGEEVGDFDARLAVLLEGSLAAQNARFGIDVLVLHFAELGGALLAAELIEQRLGVPGLQVRRTAGHVDEDERLRLGLVRHVRRFGRQRIVARGARLRFGEHGREGKRACAAEAIGEELAAISGVTNVFGHINSHTEMR